MDLVRTYAALEQHDELHLARLLVLLNVFAGKSGARSVEGLTKLAKLDFLLRYPAYLERALSAKKVDPTKASVTPFERRSIESRMIRFRYGPWDHRYRRLLNVLVGRGLVQLEIEGRTVHIRITPGGREIAKQLADADVFQIMERRAHLLKTNFDVAGTTLMRFIYETFPEIISLRYNEEI